MIAYKIYKREQGIGAIRMRLGLSQEQFAMQLGVSRSLLSKAEHKKRSLPLAALAKLSALEISMRTHALMHTTAQIAQAEQALAQKYLEEKTINYGVEIILLQHELKKMECSYAALGKSLHCLESLIGARHSQELCLSAAELHRHYVSLIAKRKRCSLSAQAALRNRIMLLQAGALLSGSNREDAGQPQPNQLSALTA